jgi:hypothetical protein
VRKNLDTTFATADFSVLNGRSNRKVQLGIEVTLDESMVQQSREAVAMLAPDNAKAVLSIRQKVARRSEQIRQVLVASRSLNSRLNDECLELNLALHLRASAGRRFRARWGLVSERSTGSPERVPKLGIRFVEPKSPFGLGLSRAPFVRLSGICAAHAFSIAGRTANSYSGTPDQIQQFEDDLGLR